MRKDVLAPAGVGLRSENLDGVAGVLLGAVGGLAAPDGDEDVAVDAGRFLDGDDLGLVLLQERAPLRAEVGEILWVQVLHRRLGELGLPGAVVALAPLDDEIGQRKVGGEALESRVEGGARDAERLRIGPQAVEERAEGIGAARRHSGREQQNDSDEGRGARAEAGKHAGIPELSHAQGSSVLQGDFATLEA